MNDDDKNPPLRRSDIKKLFSKEGQDFNPKIGIEVEKIGLYYEKSQPPSYGGNRGYLAILGKLYEELGWKIVKQKGKFILSMKRGNAYLNLESDGRIELAGSPHDSIHDLARELRIHQHEIKEVSNIFGIIWLGCGYHPFSKNNEIQDIPEERKDHLIKYFTKIKEQKNNDFALAWFKKTSGIHINIDYENEDDFARKSKVLNKLTPVLNAMFANSPFTKRGFSGYMSYRSHIAHNTGLPQFNLSKKLYESSFTVDDWLDHVFEMPLLMIQKGEEWLCPGISFGDYLEKGYEGHSASMEDFDLHIKTLWKDVKSKSVIELRCLGSLPPNLIPSSAALIKGLMYSRENLDYLEKLTSSWPYHDFCELLEDAAKYGLQAKIQGVKILEVAKDLIGLAHDALKKSRVQDIAKHDESRHLDAIKEFVFIEEKSPAEWIVENWQGKWRKSFHPVIEWFQY